MTSQEENVTSAENLETETPTPVTPETVSDTVKEEPEIDPTLTADSVLSSGLTLREAWAFYNETKKSNEEMGLSVEETDKFLSDVMYDLGTTLAQLEYCDKAGEFKEQQQVAQATTPSKPTQQPSSKGGNYEYKNVDVDGDGKLDVDASGNVVPWGALDKNGNGIVDYAEGELSPEIQGGYVPSGGEERWFNNIDENNP